jgi:hypothetical protein
VLVIDAEAEAVRTIECGVEGVNKWNGIAAVGTKLFRAPHTASSVLVTESDCSAAKRRGGGALCIAALAGESGESLGRDGAPRARGSPQEPVR